MGQREFVARDVINDPDEVVMCFRFSNWGTTKNRIQLIGREDLSKHRIILPQWFKVG